MAKLVTYPLNQNEENAIRESVIHVEVPGAWSDSVTRTVKTRFYNGYHCDGKMLSRTCYLAGSLEEARNLAGNPMQESVWGKLYRLEEVPGFEPPMFEAYKGDA